MSGIKEITVFSVGDSNEVKTWSNIPYFFTKNLEMKGIQVNRVNIKENFVLLHLYKYTIFAFLKLIYRNSNHTYFRSKLNNALTNTKIKKALTKHPNAELNVFLSFSFSGSIQTSKPTVIFGDWTYKYYIQHFLKRHPFWFEKAALKREENNINSATIVLGLFPVSSRLIKENHLNSNVHYLGNVINANYELKQEQIFQNKMKSNKILFIGNKKYLHGAIELVQEFKKLSSKNNDIELHLIGLNESDINITLPRLFYHGYLDKGNKTENNLYYELISEAKVIVNTTKGWGAFSSITEAMYYYTPVITTPYKEFTETYGTHINFGYYISDNTEELGNTIEKIVNLGSEELRQMMIHAHDSVKDFTWNNYIDKLLNLVQKELR